MLWISIQQTVQRLDAVDGGTVQFLFIAPAGAAGRLFIEEA